MSVRSVFERNTLALSGKRGDLARRVRFSENHPDFRVVESRTGLPVPVLRRGEKDFPLHSAFDPLKEAKRLIGSSFPGGFFACYGIGGGYHLRELLASPRTTGILAMDFSIDIFSALISNIDLSDIFSDPRVSVLIDPEETEIEKCILERYLPFLSGTFSGIPLRSRVDLDRREFENVSGLVARHLSRVSEDYTVQANFGKTWFRNAIGNLERAQDAVRPIPAIRKALICAAGPSLEAQLPEIAERKASGSFLIATDTTLPFFLAKGIRPDAVVTLDCQLISYYHFMDGYPEGTPLVMDLASPPLISRIASPVHFFSSGHPFCRYVSSRWRSFPILDTSGGNVTHAALSLADALGAREIRLFGADFSYPRGKTYARGTYIYKYFETRATRARPLESSFSEFLYRNPNLERVKSGSSFRYLTKPLESYRERLESLASELDADFIPAAGEGSPIKESLNAFRSSGNRSLPLFAPGKKDGDFRGFLSRYRTGLAALEVPPDPPLERIRSLTEDSQDLWTTIFPQAAAFSRTLSGKSLSGGDLLRETRSWTLGILDEALKR